jgi:hypothetical protein
MVLLKRYLRSLVLRDPQFIYLPVGNTLHQLLQSNTKHWRLPMSSV